MTANDWPDFNDLWDYNDPVETETKFRQLLLDAAQTADSSYYLQLLTQIARALGLQKKFATAHAMLDEVETAMAAGSLVEVRYLLERGRLFNSAKQPEQAVPLFQKAAGIGQAINADFYVIDALHMLGIAAPPAERLDWNLKAIAFTEQSSQARARKWLGSLYNNTAWTLFDEERYDEALDLFKKALAFRQEQDKQPEIDIARWSVAKTLRVTGRVDEALAIQRTLEAEGSSDGFTNEEIAECLYALGQVDAARPYFQTAYEMLSQIDWVAEDAARVERLKILSQ